MPSARPWPSQVDYQDALANPRTCFTDPDLRDRIVVGRTPFGAPQPISGQFANVYRLDAPDGSSACAVRLFLRDAGAERALRYEALTAHLHSLPGPPLPFMVPFEYQEAGIRVFGSGYPLVKMQWVEGEALNQWVERHLYERSALLHLAEQWRQLTVTLETARIAHGDFQHGNILVEPAAPTLRLLDYDAVFVPLLTGQPGLETGHPAYQHPDRGVTAPGPAMDRFPALVIYAALNALSVAPELWYRLDNGDNLLFRREDFEDPENSRAFSLMKTALLRSPESVRIIQALRISCAAPFSQVPALDRF